MNTVTDLEKQIEIVRNFLLQKHKHNDTKTKFNSYLQNKTKEIVAARGNQEKIERLLSQVSSYHKRHIVPKSNNNTKLNDRDQKFLAGMRQALKAYPARFIYISPTLPIVQFKLPNFVLKHTTEYNEKIEIEYSDTKLETSLENIYCPGVSLWSFVSEVEHPHVTDADICFGDAHETIHKKAATGNILQALDIAYGVLSRYNPHSIYSYSLEDIFYGDYYA